tara:strand:+ start:219 stop:848 length:630 start_codon:yes stop_codon:yes gene_type:complete
MNFCFLTSKTSWLYKNKRKEIKNIFKKNLKIFTSHEKVISKYNICFVISYFKVIPEKFLNKRTRFIINHESNLPENKGFSPLYWQILNGKSKITSTLFEATSKEVDSGKILYKKKYFFDKTLLYEQIKIKQFINSMDMIKSYLNKKKYLLQTPKKTNYLRRRIPKDSKLNVNKSIKSQFNLLRICDNKNYPAFFYISKNKYIIKIYKKN